MRPKKRVTLKERTRTLFEKFMRKIEKGQRLTPLQQRHLVFVLRTHGFSRAKAEILTKLVSDFLDTKFLLKEPKARKLFQQYKLSRELEKSVRETPKTIKELSKLRQYYRTLEERARKAGMLLAALDYSRLELLETIKAMEKAGVPKKAIRVLEKDLKKVEQKIRKLKKKNK